jgi:hypothetical protein
MTPMAALDSLHLKPTNTAVNTHFAALVIDGMFKIMANTLTENPIIQANPVALPPPRRSRYSRHNFGTSE